MAADLSKWEHLWQFSRKLLFKCNFSNAHHFLNFEARDLFFWILGSLLYLSRIVVQPDLKSCSTADIQGGGIYPPPRIWQEKNSPDLIGLSTEVVNLHNITFWKFHFKWCRKLSSCSMTNDKCNIIHNTMTITSSMLCSYGVNAWNYKLMSYLSVNLKLFCT